ncbi:hypothetical protein [Metabacillus litoralis]|uniref:hypothetical protein n=1 Tax=Metabacillus litoralis TaxID=152268 RepID=UPI001CFEFD0E|nr:hypothetical protein [Metabacillus litoralis]
MIKVIAMKENQTNMTVYYLNQSEPKAFQLYMTKLTSKGIELLANYNIEKNQFEEVTLLFSQGYLKQLFIQLNMQTLSNSKKANVL